MNNRYLWIPRDRKPGYILVPGWTGDDTIQGARALARRYRAKWANGTERSAQTCERPSTTLAGDKFIDLSELDELDGSDL